jgi:hypothetical protein
MLDRILEAEMLYVHGAPRLYVHRILRLVVLLPVSTLTADQRAFRPVKSQQLSAHAQQESQTAPHVQRHWQWQMCPFRRQNERAPPQGLCR